MLRCRSLFACMGLLALAAACTRTAPDTRDADIKAVKEAEAAWVKDIAAKDVDKFAGYYSDDASFLMPNAPIVNDRENIKAALRPMLADPNFALTFQATRAEASKGCDFVYTVGAYSMTMSSPKDKTPVTDKGQVPDSVQEAAGRELESRGRHDKLRHACCWKRAPPTSK